MLPTSRLRAAALAVALAVALLVGARQVGPRELYAAHGAYRAQVDAILDGRLALNRSPDALAHDLAWTPAGVQQVWGLGVPLWQLPFEAGARLVGLAPFPDRVALAAFLALVAFVLARAFRPSPERPTEARGSGVGAFVIAFALPGFVALVRSRIGVYEEAAIYAYGAGVGLLGGLLVFRRRPTGPRFVLLALAAGAVGLIRPTVWFYGVPTLLLAAATWVRHARANGLVALVLGVALYLGGGAALYATNAARFGDGLEFGHRLNLESLPGNLVATRFSYPFAREPLTAGLVELGGALFDRPELARARGFYATGLHAGEDDRVPRWREYYFTTYSWGYVPVLALGLAIGALAWRRARRRDDPAATQHLAWTWALLGAAPLVVFYARSPSISSRYLLDLGPAIAALAIVAWRALAAALATRWSIALLALLAAWTTAIVTSRVHRPTTGGGAVDRETADAATRAITRPGDAAHALPDAYDLDDPWLATYGDAESERTSCLDELGVRVDCDRAIPGDRVARARRDDRRWEITTSVLLAAPDDACLVDDEVSRPALVESEPIAFEVRGPPLYLNGTGWDLDTGGVPPATYVFARDPAIVDVDVAGPDPGATRVAIDGVHLIAIGGASLPGGFERRTFATPDGRALPGLRVIFLAFGDDRELASPRSPYRVRRIAWRPSR